MGGKSSDALHRCIKRVMAADVRGCQQSSMVAEAAEIGQEWAVSYW
jgi:hypothetical protein